MSTSPAAPAKKKPGRKSETPLARLQRLEQETAAARQAVAAADRERLATVGQAVIAEAESNPEFMETLRRILHERITTKAGKSAVASLLH